MWRPAATVVLQLVGEGKLSLDDSIERRLPGVVQGNGNDGRRITLRHLLQHTSGIHDDLPDMASAADYYEHRFDLYTAEQLVARAMTHRPDFEPGKGWQYTNTGYLLLGMIIERTTGHSWYDEVRARIIRPLGLSQTFWPGKRATIPGPHAKGYARFPVDGLTDVTVHREGHTAAAGFTGATPATSSAT